MLAVVAAVGISATVANGQGQVVSFTVQAGVEVVKIGTAPEGGFILTDVCVRETGNFDVEFRQGVTSKVSFKITETNNTFHLRSGIPFDGGSQIIVSHDIPGGAYFTLSGYIPTPNGSVPAVSTWGLIVLAILMLSAGTLVMTRRKPVAG